MIPTVIDHSVHRLFRPYPTHPKACFYVPVNSKTTHALPPGHLTSEKFGSKFGSLDGQMPYGLVLLNWSMRFFRGSQMSITRWCNEHWSSDPWTRHTCTMKELWNPFACDADQCFDMKVKYLTRQASLGSSAEQNFSQMSRVWLGWGGWGVLGVGGRQFWNRPFNSCGLSTLAFEWMWGW